VKAEEAVKLYGPGVQSGSWWKFETGGRYRDFLLILPVR
jgi:hypothetical protein